MNALFVTVDWLFFHTKYLLLPSRRIEINTQDDDVYVTSLCNSGGDGKVIHCLL